MNPRLILFWRTAGDGQPRHERLPDSDPGDEGEGEAELEEMAGAPQEEEEGEGGVFDLASAEDGDVLRAVLLRLSGVAAGAGGPLVPTPPLHRAAPALRQHATAVADTLACRAEHTPAGVRLHVAFRSESDGGTRAPSAFVAVRGAAAPAGLALCKTACSVATAAGTGPDAPLVCEHRAAVPLARIPADGLVLAIELRVPPKEEEDKEDDKEGESEEGGCVVSEKTVVAVHDAGHGHGDGALEARVLRRTLRTRDGRRLASRECYRSDRCLICFDEGRADTVALPCRHLCVCHDCAEPLRHSMPLCPVCRTPVVAFVAVCGLDDDGSESETEAAEEAQEDAPEDAPGHGRMSSVRRFLLEHAGAGTMVAMPRQDGDTPADAAPTATTGTTTTTTTAPAEEPPHHEDH